jgi:hypothetical protein
MDACSTKNAFTSFNISEIQAKSEDSILNAKIYKNDTITGIVSAVYLNSVFPEKYNKDEYFYVVVYDKYDNENNKKSFILNKEAPLSVEELESQNQFSDSIVLHSKWKRHYIVKFKEQGDLLQLVVKFAKHKSDKLIFKKQY